MQTGRRERQRGVNSSEENVPRRKKLLWVLLGVAAVVLAADLLSKFYVFNRLSPGESWTIIPHFLNFQVNQNKGAVFGLFQGMRVLFLIITALAVWGVLWAFKAWGGTSKLLATGLGLLLGGCAWKCLGSTSARGCP